MPDIADSPTRARERADLDLVIVTGASGGGRSTVAKALENVGYYVVDNLPESLMTTLAELAFESGDATRRTAMVVDVRSHAFTADPGGAVADLKKRGFKPRVVFVDAEDDILVRRYEKVRRAHPLQGSGRILDGIAAERDLLTAARDTADALIDTSHLNENQLRARVEEMFSPADSRRLRITALSFGFKYGIPLDADFVVDVRFLPNPYWIPELRDHTGAEAEVSEYVLQQPGAEDFVSAYADLIAATAPGFEREGKRYVTVAVGCTGGKHRSVAVSEALAARLRADGLAAHPHHRDMGLE
ncbi:MAG: RNase adapter RapZ [Stackebrandtia sp.]